MQSVLSIMLQQLLQLLYLREAIAAEYSGASYCSTNRHTVSTCQILTLLTTEVLARETVYQVGWSASFFSVMCFDLIIAKNYALFLLAAMRGTMSEVTSKGKEIFCPQQLETWLHLEPVKHNARPRSYLCIARGCRGQPLGFMVASSTADPTQCRYGLKQVQIHLVCGDRRLGQV